MAYSIKPLACDPTRIKGMSEKLLVSHYENNYGGAVNRLNAIAAQLAELDFAKAPGFVINGLKRLRRRTGGHRRGARRRRYRRGRALQPPWRAVDGRPRDLEPERLTLDESAMAAVEEMIREAEDRLAQIESGARSNVRGHLT
jgi:hypothetical protein